MRKLVSSLSMVVLLLVASAAFAQVRGKGRLQGAVTDKETGKPVAGAKVSVAIAGNTTEPIIATSDAKGRWSALGLIGGQWNIDIEADGYVTSRGSVNVSELQMVPPIKTALAREVKQEPVEEPVVSSVPEEAVAAVRAGEELMKQEKYAEAAAEFEKALVHVTDNDQLKQATSQAYYKAGELKKAIAMLEQVVAADPSNHGLAMLLVNLYLEDGRLAEGKALVDQLPEGAITDPTVYTNVGILFMNKQSLDDALAYFTKAVELDRSRADSYYYRGLAYVQMKQYAEAKAEFNRVVELAPDSTEAAEAKQLLAQLK